MGFIFELLFQFLGELLLQIAAETLVQLGFRSLTSVIKKRPHPVLAFIGCILWGAIAGGISLFFFSGSFIESDTLHMVNLIITPIAIGLIMMAIGIRRTHKGKLVVSLDKFINAYIFALAMSYIRFEWAA